MGKHHSLKTKMKISSSRLLRRDKLGYINSPETREKISKSNIGLHVGNRSSTWKGGVTALTRLIRSCVRYAQWRKAVFVRDNFTCQGCGQFGGQLNAHHIKPFSEIFSESVVTSLEQSYNYDNFWDINNGITLCSKCHLEVGKE